MRGGISDLRQIIFPVSSFDRYLWPGPPSAPALSPVPHLLGAALAAVRSQPSEEFRRSGDQGAAGGAQQEFTRSWAESQQPRSFSVLQSPVQSEAVGDYNSRYVDQQQQQQSDYYNSSGALSPSIFDQCQPYSSEEASEGKRQSLSELSQPVK